ncbi:MAG: hypothetical protein ACI4L9_02695 [Candidatus Coproplasma sp.]
MIVYDEIFESFSESERINVYTDGKCKTYESDSSGYNDIISVWDDMTEGARQMPAYGVSLNVETEKAIKNGLWLEFIFLQPCECAGMNFEKLLVEVQSEYSGFNVIRYNLTYGYDGRCYYIDLIGKNMSKLYDYLSNI